MGIKVGEVRDKKGHQYHGFVPDTINAAVAAGLQYYNEAILVTPLGSVPVRAAKAFEASRKLAKTHQNVLWFYKGDARNVQCDWVPEVGSMITDDDKAADDA